MNRPPGVLQIPSIIFKFQNFYRGNNSKWANEEILFLILTNIFICHTFKCQYRSNDAFARGSSQKLLFQTWIILLNSVIWPLDRIKLCTFFDIHFVNPQFVNIFQPSAVFTLLRTHTFLSNLIFLIREKLYFS